MVRYPLLVLSFTQVIDLLMGLFGGAVVRHGGVPETPPINLNGPFSLLSGPFSDLIGPFAECLNVGTV